MSTPEKWRPVVGYEGFYEVSDLGRIRRACGGSNSAVPGHVIAQKPVKSTRVPYMKAHLSKAGVTRDVFVHRVVAEAFVPNPDNKPEVNHKDGDGTNNRAENLEWVTRSENVRHSYQVLGHNPKLGKPSPCRKFTDEEVRAIRAGDGTVTEWAQRKGVSVQTVSAIKHGKTYRDVV